jgi:hypothetical protein
MGGFFSLIVKFIIYGYVGLTMKQMLFLEENKLASIASLVDLNTIDPVPYNSSHMTTFQTLKNG